MSKNDLPLVCILVLNWNGGKMMEDCIRSLKMTSYKNYKTIVIDNGSSDREAVKNLKKINKDIEIVYLDKNYGYTIGINAGYKYARKKYNPSYYCEMNNDIETIQKEWLTVQIEEMEKHKNYGISSGKLAFPDGGLQMFDKNSDKGKFEQDHGQYDYIKEVPYVRGACLVVRKEVVEKIGYPDESMFYGPSDIDYCYRAGKAGFKVVYNGFAKSIHIAGHSGLSHKKDLIFQPQLEGTLICWFRHNGFKGGLKMALRQFARVFVIRKNPYAPKTIKNLYFNWTFPERLAKFSAAIIHALKNYKHIENNSIVKIIKIE